MSAFRFVHTADLHLDSPFQGLREVAPDVAQRLRQATFETFDRIVDLCIEQRVDFLLIAGDIYDSRDHSLRAQLRFRDGLKRLSDRGIASYVVHGNHDPLNSWATTLRWPELVHVFGGATVTVMPVLRGGETIAQIYGISYPVQEVRQNLARDFRRTDPGVFAIGLLHCNVGSNTGHEPYAQCSLDDLLSGGMDYWALGHVHNHGVIFREGPVVVYPGNPQGRHPRELGPRGCYVVEVGHGRNVKANFVATDSVRWSLESISIDAVEDEDSLIQQLETLCDKISDQGDGRDTVCRVTLTGRGPLHGFLARPGVVRDLEQRLRERSGSSAVWVERIEVRTNPEIDIEARRSGQDFIGDVLRLFDEVKHNTARLNALRSELRPLLSLPAARKFLGDPDDRQLTDWLQAAELLSVSLLLEEDE